MIKVGYRFDEYIIFLLRFHPRQPDGTAHRPLRPALQPPQPRVRGLLPLPEAPAVVRSARGADNKLADIADAGIVF